MGWFSFITDPIRDFTDDVLGFDPNGGGIYNVANDILGDTIADDILGLDPSGGGIVPLVNAGANAAVAYGLGQAAGGLFGGDAAAAAADADIAGGMVPEFGTNAAYDSAMAAAMTPEAIAAMDAIVATPSVVPDVMGPMTQTELGSSFENYMKDLGINASEAVTLPASVQKVLTDQFMKTLVRGALTAAAVPSMPSAPAVAPIPAYKPANTMPQYSPEYFQQVQDYYTGYMPNQPRDVATPLQDWYGSGYTGPDSVTKKLFGV
jgi:hypothetical protein